MVIHNYYYTPNVDRYASYFFTHISTRPWQLPLKPVVMVPRMTTDVNSCPLERSTAVRMETLRNHTEAGYTRSTFVDCFICGNNVKIVTMNWWEILYRPVLMSWWLEGGAWGALIAKREEGSRCTQQCLAALWWQANFLIRDDRYWNVCMHSSPGQWWIKSDVCQHRNSKKRGFGHTCSKQYRNWQKIPTYDAERNNALHKGYHKELKLVDSMKSSTGTDDLSLKQSVCTQHFTMVI
jgi:hypothetical protein